MKTIQFCFYLSIINWMIGNVTNRKISPIINEIICNDRNTNEYEILYSWSRIESEMKKGNVNIEKIAIYTQVQDGVAYNYYYSIFNSETKEISFHLTVVSLFITSGHDVGHSIKVNETLNMNLNMKIHNAKYNQINDQVCLYLNNNNKRLKYIFSIDYYPIAPHQDIIYYIKAIINEKQSLVYFIIFENKDNDKYEVIKLYE